MNIKKLVPIGFCALLAVFSIINYANTVAGQKATIEAQSAKIESLANRINTQTVEKQSSREEASVTKSDKHSDRHSADDKAAAEFLTTIFSWDSWEDYTKARNTIMDKYGFKESDPFMKVFMPRVNNRTANGKNYNKIDTNGLNMTYENMKSYILSVEGEMYSYATVVDVSSTWDNGGEAIVHAVFFYTVDSKGNLSNIDAMTVVE